MRVTGRVGVAAERIASWLEQFVNSYTQCFGNQAAVFIRGHATAHLNARENIPRDVALQNLKLCHQRVLRPPLLVTQPGNLPSDKIGIVLHNSLRSSCIVYAGRGEAHPRISFHL
jgi:hypothetical protein